MKIQTKADKRIEAETKAREEEQNNKTDIPPDYHPEEKEFSDRLDAAKFTASVHGKIQQNVSSDFTLSYFGPEKQERMSKDKEYTKEMFEDANLAKNLNDNIFKVAQIEGIKITKDDERKIKDNGNQIFRMFMDDLNMLSVLNRNVPNNPILGGLMGVGTTEEDQQDVDTGILNKIFGKKGKKLRKEEEE